MSVTAPPPLQPSDGVIREARRRQYLRRMQTAGACLLAVSGFGIGVGALLAGGRSPHRAASRDPVGLAGRSPSASSFGIRLSPSLDGGTYGWCVGIEERPGAIAGGGCGMTPVSSTPIAFRLSGGGARTRTWSLVVLTTPRVAAVLVNGKRRVPTLALSGLPYGLRAARLVMPLAISESPRGRPTVRIPREPTLTALDAQGRALPSPLGPIAQSSVRASAHVPCALQVKGVAGLTAQWSHVASALTPFPGRIIGQAFFSCIDTEYYWHNWPLDAAILLDAARPRARAAAIPGLKAVKGEAGYFNGPGDFKGELSAVRRGNAWLVIAGGQSLGQRIELLRHLKVTIHL